MNFVTFNAPSHLELMAYASELNSESTIAKAPPCFIAAIMWRETGGQNIYQRDMPHSPGCGVGLTQITSSVDWSNPDDPTLAGFHLMKPADNLYVCAAYYAVPLLSNAERLQRDNPRAFDVSCRGQRAFAAAAGYNAGWGKVLLAIAKGVDADTYTTNNYAADVLAKYETLVEESQKHAGVAQALQDGGKQEGFA